MKKNICFILLLLLILSFKVEAQFYFIENELDQVEIEFLKKKIEVKRGDSFFNVLKISNPTNKVISFEAKFSYPAGWSFMGDKRQNISLNPSDSILIPYRAAPSTNTKGNIGYAFVASLSDSKGNTFKNEYSFVNIPKISNFRFKPIQRVVYFDQQKNISFLELHLSNRGNVEEFININFLLSQGVTTDGAQNGVFVDELLLEANTDTIVSLPIKVKARKSNIDKKFHRIQVKVNTRDTTIKTSFWAKELENTYINQIPYTYKMFSVEAIAQNIFADKSAIMNYHISGYFLPKGNSVFHYDYQTYGSTTTATDMWTYSRILLQYSNKKILVEAGDITRIMGHNMFGRGGLFEYRINNKNMFTLVATQQLLQDVSRAAASFQHSFNKFRLKVGGSYEQNNYIQRNSIIGFSEVNLITKKIGSLSVGGAISNAQWNHSNNTQLSFSTHLNYDIRSKKNYLNINGHYSPIEFSGYLPGRTQVRSIARHIIDKKRYFLNNFNYFKNSPPILRNSQISAPKNGILTNKLTYNLHLAPSVIFSAGPIIEMREGSNFYNAGNSSYFKTNSTFGFFALRKRNNFLNSTFNVKITTGYNWVKEAIVENPNQNILNNNWLSAIFGLSYRARNWGFSATYYHGPYSINQQFNYFYHSYSSKNLIIMPYADIFIIPKYLRFSIRPNYTYYVRTKTGRLNVNSEITAYPGREWEIVLTNAYNYSATQDFLLNEKETFSASYFEMRIRKSFNFNQPKYQYHNVKYYFFKDLNGNNIKDNDEPGIKDVLLSVQKDNDLIESEEYNTASHFMTMDLLSDINGYIRYDNIPNGFYSIEYKAIGQMEGAFSSENSVEKIYISKDEVFYIPFHENNKIFGNIILNRSKLSNLGIIDHGNIKVSAEDSKGKKYSTLTNANGNFTIYVPNVDRYTVRVNNIYFENFELEQNDYKVQLNGYKQFEINFIFNEKKRKINFSSSYEYGATTDAPGIEIIRRTNLSGTVKDATTLKPIVATIKIVDNKGKEITKGNSSLKTGIFSLSFIAGDDYTVEVNTDEYWFHAEKLYSNQIVTFKNMKKSILLKGITVGQLIPMKTLNFDAGSYEIPITAFPELERLMKVLRKNPTVKISIHGHADDLEILDSSSDLALERAKLIAKYLIANGYNRVKYSGHSNTKPVAENDTEDGRRLNRRVEIVVTGK